MSATPEVARYRAMRRVTVWGALANLVLSVAKLLFGYLGHSQALIADGVHSLSDLASDAFVLVAARYGSQAADEEHPYGHARIETVGSVGLGLLLLLVAGGIAWDAIERIRHPEFLYQPGALALAVAALSILVKEVLYRYTVVVARQVRSELLRANAWHHRSDAISSVIVVGGVGGAMLGMPYLDAIGAVGVALMIVKIGVDLVWQNVRELVDTGLEPDKLAAIRQAILSVDGVAALHLLKTRRMGAAALVDVHILLAEPRISVSEGHQISETVGWRLINGFDEISDVMVHIDPEDDERVAPNRSLPLREPLLARLRGRWAGIEEAQAVRHIQLHYLGGRVHVELYLPLALIEQGRGAMALTEAFSSAVADLPELADVRLYFE